MAMYWLYVSKLEPAKKSLKDLRETHNMNFQCLFEREMEALRRHTL